MNNSKKISGRIFSLYILLFLSVNDSIAASIKSEYLEVEGTKIHYLSSGSGKLVLLLHGFPDSAITWKKQLQSLGRNYKAVAIDLPGFNLSDKPESIDFYRLENISGLISRFANALGYKRYHLIGHDIGGQIAWKISFDHPDQVNSLIILNSPHPILFCREYMKSNSPQKEMSSYISKIKSGEYNESFYTANNFAVLKKLSLSSPESAFLEKKYLSAWAKPSALRSMLNYYKAMTWPPACDFISKQKELESYLNSNFSYRGPVLVIWGEKDPWLSSSSLEGIEQFAPKIRIERLANAGHQIFHDEPKTVTELIVRFLGNLSE